MNAVVVESAVRVVDSLAAWAWRASWEGAALAVIVAILLWLLGGRISPAWRFALWALVLIRLAMPAVVGVNWKWFAATAPPSSGHAIASHVSQRPPVIVYTVDPADGATATRIVMNAPAPQVQARPDRWLIARRITACAWLIGIALLGLRVAWSSLRLARAVTRMKRIEDPRLLDALRSCCAQIGIQRTPTARNA